MGENRGRNIYKGHMDKEKGLGSRVGSRDGWGRGEWWAEDGDNYT